MRKPLILLYKRLVVRRRLYRLHRLLFTLATRGMGLLNFEDAQVSGEADFVRRVVRCWPHLTVVDVGANVGNYANQIKALAPAAIIYALEPHPQTFQRLQVAAQARGYIAVNLGCGEASGRMTLYDYPGQTGGTSHATLYRAALDRAGVVAPATVAVELTTLDAYAEQIGIERIHLLKVDTEGHELAILRGAQRLIQSGKIDVVQFEFNEMNVASRSFFRDFMDLLPNHRFFRLLPSGLVSLEPYQSLECELFAYQNIAAVKRDSELSRTLGN